MTMGAFTLFNNAKKFLGDGTLDLDTNTIKCMMLTSAFTPNVATQSVKANIVANEVANGNGYLTGGVTVACTWVLAGGTVTFDSADPSWTGATAGFAGRYLVWYASGGHDAGGCLGGRGGDGHLQHQRRGPLHTELGARMAVLRSIKVIAPDGETPAATLTMQDGGAAAEVDCPKDWFTPEMLDDLATACTRMAALIRAGVTDGD